MTKIHFTGDTEGLKKGITYMKKDYDLSVDEEGIPVKLTKKAGQDTLSISFDGEKGEIIYTTTSNFFRQLALWLVNYNRSQSFYKEEKTYFDKTGAMIDVSRNAVLTLDTMKEFLRQMAKLGLNLAMLYTEDTFEVKDYPYFGYLRGRYTKDELKELDNYAYHLGIEMVPCIQTLGHLHQVLQYGTHQDIQDTSDVLLVGEPKTYDFLEHIIREATEPFRSERIHIGMDEAFGVGTGRYKQLNGEKDTFAIMNKHVRKVTEITEKLGLESMLWSDMYFRAGSKTGDYYDLDVQVPKEVIEGIPHIDMVFWDYYHEDQNAYKTYLEKHMEMKQKVVFAGGVWTWNGISPNYGKTVETTKAGLAACKELGIKEVFATMWGDDGSETPIMTALPGLQVFADLSYREKVDEELCDEISEFNTGYSFQDFYLLNELDETPGVGTHNLELAAPSKVLLWQDPLLGRFDKGIKGLGLNEHYKELSEKLKCAGENDKGKYKELFEFYSRLARVLSVKAEFGLSLKSAYDESDRSKLSSLLFAAEKLTEDLEALRLLHQAVWMTYYKPFGWEVLDIRYGGIIARVKTVTLRLSAYLNNELDKLEELEEERLADPSQKFNIGRGEYQTIVTTSRLSGL